VRAAAGTGEIPWAPRRATPNQEINVPKSRGRTKAVYTPPPRAGKAKVSPRWLVPTMLGCLVVGLAWIALFYITSQNLPLPALGPWNLAIGFAFIIAGLGFATKWR
jgi:Cell division protein CrgA